MTKLLAAIAVRCSSSARALRARRKTARRLRQPRGLPGSDMRGLRRGTRLRYRYLEAGLGVGQGPASQQGRPRTVSTMAKQALGSKGANEDIAESENIWRHLQSRDEMPDRVSTPAPGT